MLVLTGAHAVQQGGMRGPRPYGQQQMGRPGQQQREPWPPAASGRFEDADDDPLAPSLGPRNRVPPCPLCNLSSVTSGLAMMPALSETRPRHMGCKTQL